MSESRKDWRERELYDLIVEKVCLEDELARLEAYIRFRVTLEGKK